MTAPAKKWYAVYTQARMEKWARSNLWERDHEDYSPQFLRQRRHAPKTDWVSAPLFPRYLFVAVDPDNPVNPVVVLDLGADERRLVRRRRQGSGFRRLGLLGYASPLQSVGCGSFGEGDPDHFIIIFLTFIKVGGFTCVIT